MMADLPEVLTTNEAAALLRVDRRLLCAEAKRGNIPGNKVGRDWRFPRDVLLRFIHGSNGRAPHK